MQNQFVKHHLKNEYLKMTRIKLILIAAFSFVSLVSKAQTDSNTSTKKMSSGDTTIYTTTVTGCFKSSIKYFENWSGGKFYLTLS